MRSPYTRKFMSTIDRLFTTKIYRSQFPGQEAQTLNGELRQAIAVLAEEDQAGQRWCEANAYEGYTSYASLNDLAWRMPEFQALQAHLDTHVARFALDLDYDLAGSRLALDSLWVNVLDPGGIHSAHIHPHSVISGTYYVTVPHGAAAIRFEDPRLTMMMAAPVRKRDAQLENQSFVSFQPEAGMIMLWESWLRHDVPMNTAQEERISISFNYQLADADD